MRSLAAVLWFAGLLGFCSALELVPSLVWTSAGVYGVHAEPIVEYRTVEFIDLWNAVVDEAVKGKDADDDYLPTVVQRPEVLVVFVGDQMKPWQLSGDTASTAPLRKAFLGAATKVVFNDVRLEDGRVMHYIPTSLEASGADVSYVAAGDEANLKSILASNKGSNPKVVVVGGSGDLEGEMSQISSIDQILNDAEMAYMVLFVSEFESSEPGKYIDAAPQRRLQAVEVPRQDIDYEFCDHLCVTRVKFLEGIILAFVLALALLAGLCCMHILDTPTQFEKPDDADS